MKMKHVEAGLKKLANLISFQQSPTWREELAKAFDIFKNVA